MIITYKGASYTWQGGESIIVDVDRIDDSERFFILMKSAKPTSLDFLSAVREYIKHG